MFGDNVKDSYLSYTGKNFPELDVESGQKYSDLTENLLKIISDLKGVSFNMDDAFQDCGCTGEVISEDAINCIIRKVGNMSTDDVFINPGVTKIFGGVSKYALPLIGQVINFDSVVNAGSKTATFTYDTLPLVSNLPEGYRHSSTRVVAFGNKLGGRSTIRESNQVSGTVDVPFEKFPFTVDIDVRILTPGGDIVLRGTTGIIKEINTSGAIVFEVSDYTEKKRLASAGSAVSLSDFILSVNAKIQELMSFYSSLTEYKVGDLGIGVKAVAGSNAAAIAALVARVESLERQLADCDCGSSSSNC